jgi:hypothetical protein
VRKYIKKISSLYLFSVFFMTMSFPPLLLAAPMKEATSAFLNIAMA